MLAEQDGSNLEELIDMKVQLNWEMDKDEAYWEQWTQANLLKLRDKNTKLFHNHASQRRWSNLVKYLEHSDGRLTDDSFEMEGIAKSFFENLFASQGGAVNREHILLCISRYILEKDNVLLKTPYKVKEVHQSLKTMGPTKALSMDGFLAIFFKNFREL